MNNLSRLWAEREINPRSAVTTVTGINISISMQKYLLFIDPLHWWMAMIENRDSVWKTEID